jgi:hypothetical protein
VYSRQGIFVGDEIIMSSVEIALTVKTLIAEMRQLSQDEQRNLASAVLGEKNLEAFVEELEDQLSCERAATEGSPEKFNP